MDKKNKHSFGVRLKKDMKRYWMAYLLVAPVVLYYLIFQYKPMYGVIIAFKDFTPIKGIWGSEWVGLQHFKTFVSSYYFGRLVRNTLTISLTSLVFGFPAPIIFALLLNELRSNKFKRVVQTISYMPHFISTVIMCSLVHLFVAADGPIVSVLSLFGLNKVSLLTLPKAFVPTYVISGIWESIGWGAIIYLSALAGVDQELYDAAMIDGANRWQQTIYVTIPSISSMIIIRLLLRLGHVMSVGYEKVMLLYNELTYETADVISTYVYRKGLVSYEWSYSAAVGLFNTIINLILIIMFNKISKKVSEVSLW